MKNSIETRRPFLVITRERDHLRSRTDPAAQMTEHARVDWATEFVQDHSSRDAFVLDILNNHMMVFFSKEKAGALLKRLTVEHKGLIDEAVVQHERRLEQLVPDMAPMPDD